MSEKLTIWEDSQSPTWDVDSFTVKNEAMGAMRVALSVVRNEWPEFIPNSHTGLHGWEVVITHEGNTMTGRVSSTERRTGTIYMTLVVD